MCDFKVVNIKVSAKISSICYQDLISSVQHLICKERLNFIVIFDVYTYTIFRPNAVTGYLHCNVTKIKTYSDIPEAFTVLQSLLPSINIIEQSIDNITLKGETDMKQNLENLFLKLCTSHEVKYNLQKFPALFIRVPFQEGGVTIFVFASGKVCSVGSKSLTQVEKISEWVKKYINK